LEASDKTLEVTLERLTTSRNQIEKLQEQLDNQTTLLASTKLKINRDNKMKDKIGKLEK
jgi:hypothetical protein